MLLGGCAEELWKDAPEFEMSDLICPVPAGKFLEDANFVSSWSLLGPLNPGKEVSIHAEYLNEEGMLTGNRRAPRGCRWCRVGVAAADVAEAEPGEIDFGKRFKAHSREMLRSVFYACATLKCDRELIGMTLHVSGGGLLKVWLNGQVVYSRENPASDPRTVDRVTGLMLRKGFNRIVVKYLDGEKDFSDRRKFSLRFTDAAGNLSLIR